MPTTFTKQHEVTQAWFHCHAEGEVLGRLAVRIARVLMGKHKPTWTPNIDCGDYVVVTGAGKIGVTGNKEQDKHYRFYSGYAGGQKQIPVSRMRATHPERLIQLAVRRMLPKTILGRHMFKKLKVYAGSDHPHQAQKPAPLP